MWKTIFQWRKNASEHGFKHKGNNYATLPWFGTKIAQKHAKRIKTKTWSTKVFVAKWNATFSRSQLQGNVRSQRVVHAQWRLERNVTFPVAVVGPATSVACGPTFSCNPHAMHRPAPMANKRPWLNGCRMATGQVSRVASGHLATQHPNKNATGLLCIQASALIIYPVHLILYAQCIGDLLELTCTGTDSGNSRLPRIAQSKPRCNHSRWQPVEAIYWRLPAVCNDWTMWMCCTVFISTYPVQASHKAGVRTTAPA